MYLTLCGSLAALERHRYTNVYTNFNTCLYFPPTILKLHLKYIMYISLIRISYYFISLLYPITSSYALCNRPHIHHSPLIPLPNSLHSFSQDSIVASAPEDISEGSFLDSEFQRTTHYLRHPVFNKYVSYIQYLIHTCICT